MGTSKLKLDLYLKEKETVRQEARVESEAQKRRRAIDEANGIKAPAGWTAVTPLPKCPQCGKKDWAGKGMQTMRFQV